ncbi:protein winged eye isoform X3 [Chironomus tepperi]|uniref:protein winged eye isoform X3 n=1 Tax=Chironomus tepperi TaxID=113505 RepID=UPI00391F1983
MLGNGARFLGPSAGSTNNINNQHQTQFNRSIWPTATTTFQANGSEFTVPITDSTSIFAPGFTPSPTTVTATSSPFIPTLPFEFVKNWNTGTVGFSQANSIFVQSHTAAATDFLNCTTTVTSTPSSQSIKRPTEIGRWESTAGSSLIEPLQIHLPVTPTNLTSYTTTSAIKSENISSGSSTSSSSSSKTPTSSSTNNNKRGTSKSTKHNKNINDCILNLHQQHQSKSIHETNFDGSGCSRTLPIAWNSSSIQHLTNVHNQNNVGDNSATGTLLQIKREPCQVSEVTTSNNLLATSFSNGTPTIIKIEQKSPTSTSQSNFTSISSSSALTNMDACHNSGQNNAGATATQAIPIGIAVGRQRLQETTTSQATGLQAKDLNRFSLGLADLGTIPLTDVMHQNHQSVAMTQNRTPPTLFQYPTMPMEIPTLPPPVGFQLVRDPSTGQFLFLPTTTTIVTLDKINISCIEPIPQALVWPTYPQTTSATSLQPPHLLLPPLQQSLQPPPLALLGSDYLTASTTLHQSHLQHTSTHSTRLVALTSSSSDTSKRTKCTQQTTTTAVPLPLPAHTLIKIEDGVNHHHHGHHGHHGHQSTATAAQIYEHEKSIQTASIATAVQTPTEINGQFFYQHPGLIQIAPQPQSTSVPAALMETTDCRHSASSPPPLQLTAAAAAAVGLQTHSSSISDTQLGHIVPPAIPPEVQDANIQTSPIMSEDDNSSGHDGMTHHDSHYDDEYSQDHSPLKYDEKPMMMAIETEVTREEIAEHRESVPDTSVTSSSLIVNIKQQIESPDTSINDAKDDEMPEQPSQSEEQGQQEQQHEPVDLSGLQLLSNSIDVFQKKTIKQEPSDQMQITSPTIASTTNTPPIIESVVDKPLVSIPRSSVPKSIPEDGCFGLTLLCALAEQRLEEDFQSNNTTTTSSPTTNEIESHQEIKKRKHKVKSSKKSKHKEMKKAKKRKHSDENDDGLKTEFADSFKRVKTRIDNFPIASVDDVFRLMKEDMQKKLANITRQCEEKRRELKQIKTDGPEKEQASSSMACDQLETGSKSTDSPLKLSIIPALSPSFSSSSNSESLVDIPKLSSDTDSGSKDDGEGSNTERSKRKFSIPNKNHGDKQQTETIVAKKSKSFVGYILASKQKLSSTTATVTTTTASPTIDSWTSSIKNGKASLPFVKTEDQDGRGILKESAFKDDRVFSIFGDGNSQKFQASSPLTIPSVSRHQQPYVKHHSKHKKHKERRRHRERQRLDSRVKISSEHLKQTKTRVLMAQGGLFYAGTLTPVEPSEVYAITLDGERGNKPHIMPRDEIFKQAILEVQPKTTAECPPGTRLCAYWSQQYRCLYPGVATVPSSPDSDIDEKYVNVEFDDGDSGRIVLDHIRFLISNYPIVEYDPNPLQSLSKRKRQSSHAPSSDHDQKSSCNQNEGTSITKEERKRLKKMRKEKIRLQSSPDHAQDSFAAVLERKHKKKHKCQDELCKHRKHKKRRKHKKHHHRELEEEDRELQHHVQSAMLISSNDSNNNEEEFDEDSLSLNESVTQYEIVKKVDQDMEIKDDPDTMESSVTESSGSLYNPKKATSSEKLNRSNESGSKIAAFLPARQLWAWSGKGFKRSTGRVKKQFYRSIQRGKETISVGDSAVFLSTGRPDRPYIGHIESMWETANGHMVVRVKWFYHPEETQGCPNLKYPGALFESPHEDENDVQTISHKCEVLQLDGYIEKFGDEPKQYESIYDNNDTYYLAGSYDPTLYHMKMQSDIPVLPEDEKWV